MRLLKESVPALIITDIMMPGTDGMELTRQIKENHYTQHIPIVILSARNENDDKVKGLNSGADVYVSKPFKANYLRAVIARLLKSRREMRDYYNSAASAYEYSEGKLLHQEDRRFVNDVLEYIEKNIEDSNLNVESLAAHFQTGVRNIYRRFKDLDLPSPNDFIKKQRILKAAKLLVTTNLTVQEIMYQCGFQYKSHFYKEFAKHYNTTPKGYRQAALNDADADTQPDDDSLS